MKKQEYRYIQFPLCLLMETYRDINKGIGLIVGYGVMHYALKLKYDVNDVARQLAYDYYRRRDRMQARLITSLLDAAVEGLFTDDDDYNGFAGASFSPDKNIEELLILFSTDAQLKDDAILNYKLHQAAEFLDITLISFDNIIKRYDDACAIVASFESEFGKDAMPSCKPADLFEYRENPKDIDLFRAYIGIISMVGRRLFVSTNKPAIISRMLGCKSKKVFEFYCNDKNLFPVITKYRGRYQMDKLLFTLAKRHYIMYLSKPGLSVMYVSRYMEPKELAELVSQSRKKNDLRGRIRAASNLL